MLRIFNLDAQLLFDAVLVIINVFILFLIGSYKLFDPVRDLIKKRQNLIESNVDTAVRDKEDAAKLKLQYDDILKNADAETDLILSEARKKAIQRENVIIEEAKMEAAKIIQRANIEVELEKKKAVDDVKKEMITVASAMASKMVSVAIDTKEQEALIDQTLNEMGDSIWQS